MIAWAIDTLIGVTLLMLLVLAARRPVAHFFGAGWAYALWLLPLARLFLPPLDLFGSDVALARDTIIFIPPVGEAVAPSEGSGQWLALLLALWAGGAAVFASWQHAAYGAFMLSLGKAGRPACPPEYGGVPVIESKAVDGPLAVGLLSRRIVVPPLFEYRYSPAEQRLALEHELIHHRRFDLWWNAAALVLLAINWFNPIAHFAFRAFRIDQELACDAAVTRRAPAERHDYARALVKSASRPGQIAACPLNSADQLKRRLKMMNQHRASFARTLGGGVALGAMVVAGLAVGSPGLAQEEARPAPRILLAQAGQAAPIISDKDIATLREKCGASGAMVRSDGTRTVTCGNGVQVDDPEVRAIVRKTAERARAHVVEVEKHVDRAAVAKAVAKARVEAVEVSDAMGHAREALKHARVELARIDLDGLRHMAIAPPVPPVPPTLTVPVVRIAPHARLSPEAKAEIAAALAEAREAMAEARLDHAEILRDADRERREALREADRERRQALREAEEARREALREVRQAEKERRHALRDAEIERRNALRELERERGHSN